MNLFANPQRAVEIRSTHRRHERIHGATRVLSRTGAPSHCVLRVGVVVELLAAWARWVGVAGLKIVGAAGNVGVWLGTPSIPYQHSSDVSGTLRTLCGDWQIH